jgi:glucokinase
MTLHAGIDVGGTNLRVGIVQGTRVIHRQRHHADFARLCRLHSPEAAWARIVEAMAEPLCGLLLQFPEIRSIGIGFPGFMDPVTGTVLQSPNLPGLHCVDLAGDMSARIGRPVIVENDGMAAAYGEYRLCDHPAYSFGYIGLGTGVGGGLIHAGKPFTGQHGAAMEVGHLIVDYGETARPCGCGNRGCLERYASASGVSLSYKLATGFELDSIKIAELAQAGDIHALAAFSLAGTYLAQAVAHIAKILDIGQMVIGGGLSNGWEFMQAAFDAQLRTDLIPALRGNLSVTLSSSGDEAGIIGAALLSAAGPDA